MLLVLIFSFGDRFYLASCSHVLPCFLFSCFSVLGFTLLFVPMYFRARFYHALCSHVFSDRFYLGPCSHVI